MFRRIRGAGTLLGLGGLLLAGCGLSVAPGTPPSGGRGQFVACSGSSGKPAYAILDNPGPDCRPLVAGSDYADGRVIVGLQPGATDDQLRPALAAYRATIASSLPALAEKVLLVPPGTVPQAVTGLARYPFIAFASPDLIEHINMTT